MSRDKSSVIPSLAGGIRREIVLARPMQTVRACDQVHCIHVIFYDSIAWYVPYARRLVYVIALLWQG